jgi:RNA polymerase sigma-70 factor (ECF subfamily)
VGLPSIESTWVEPYPEEGLGLKDGYAAPEARYEQREAVELAFVAALQHLPPNQRAVLILREVLQWKASEVAELLGTTVASVNSALQRARATLADREIADTDTYAPTDPDQRDLLDRYVEAFERYDMEALTLLLREDAVMSMPPYDLWLRGPADIVAFMVGPGAGCEGSRLVPTVANGTPAFGHYKPTGDGGHEPWALQVIEVTDGKIAGFHSFLDTARWFPLFGLPERL